MSKSNYNPAAALRETLGWRRYVLARCVSAAGSALTWIALPVLAYQLTGSPVWTAAVVAFDAIPYLALGLLAGRAADRRDRRSLIVASDAVSGLAMLSLLAADGLGQLSPWHLLIVACVVQSCFVYGDAAHLGGLPTLVGNDNVMAANSRLYGYLGILECVGPAVAGVALLAVSPVVLLAIDGGTFLACALLIATMNGALSRQRAEDDSHPEPSILEGLTYLWSQPLIRDLTLANLLISVCNGALFAQLVIWAAQAHDVRAGDPLLGVLYTVISVGGIVGSFVVERMAELGTPRTVIGLASVAGGVAALAAAWSPWFLIACVLFGVFAGATFCAMVIGVSIRQSASPERLVGMVNTTGRMLALGIGYPLGALGSALVARLSGSSSMGMTIAFGLVVLVWPFLVLGERPDRSPATESSIAGAQVPEAG